MCVIHQKKDNYLKLYKAVLSFTAFIFLIPSSIAQIDSNAMNAAKTIKAEELKINLEVLASDEYEGRETGQKGQKMAAAYIKNHFEKIGIPPLEKLKQGYFQEFSLDVYQPQELSISINGKTFEARKDFFSFSSILSDTVLFINSLQFAGYGINSEKYNDFQNEFFSDKNKEDRNTIFLSNEPLDKNGNSIITGNKVLSDWSTNPRKKSLEAQKQRVNIQFIIEDNLIRMRISKIENIFNIPSTPNYIGNFIPNKTIKSRYSISNIKTNLSSTSD